MALREVREQGDPILSKPCREVTELTERLRILIEDMKETMAEHDGVGLAAPQVGVLRKIVVVDVRERDDDGNIIDDGTPGPLVMINPVLLESSGEQTGPEGCLSLPGMYGTVTRPDHIKAKYLDENMEEQIVEGDGLLARAVCHELDHLAGHMYTEFVEGALYTAEELEEQENAKKNKG